MTTFDLRKNVKDYVETADVRLLKMIKALVESYHDDSERISVEQYNRELEISEGKIESGDYYTQNQVQEIIQKWEKE